MPLLGGSGKEPICQFRGHKILGFDPWVRKIPWGRAWHPTPVFLPGEPHEQRSLVGYSPQGHKESDTYLRILRWDHPGFRMGPKPSNWWCCNRTERKDGDADTQRPCEGENSVWSDAATRWEKLGAPRSWSLWRERDPAHTLISDFWPPELWEKTFLSQEAPTFVVSCCSSPRKGRG